MSVNYGVSIFSICTFLLVGTAGAMEIGKIDETSVGGDVFIDVAWMNMIVNKTPVKSKACPLLETDVYKDGFKVARQKSFYGSLSASLGRWFPRNSQWASVGIGPLKNSFGVYYTEINQLQELEDVKEKKLPNSYHEIQKWKVTDSAYWESQGGVSFYLGTGISPVSVGAFAVATGGWVSFLQKTGPNKVYVELLKKKIRSVDLGVGIGLPIHLPIISIGGPGAGVGTSFSSSRGFAYEFTLDNHDSIEAFERFMDGDVTKAQDLIKIQNSGVAKFSDMSESRIGFSENFGIITPLLPIINFHLSRERAYDKTEEKSVWDENTIKNKGIYVKQRTVSLLNKQLQEVRSFAGGKIVHDDQNSKGQPNHYDKTYGNFKFLYQSNWGQERRLRRYINKVRSLTGLTEETCTQVPSMHKSLGFNQVILEVNWSDDYVKELIGHGKTQKNLLEKIRSLAQSYQDSADQNDISCVDMNNDNDNDDNDYNCISSSSEQIDRTFEKLKRYSANMNESFISDPKKFSKNLANFGEAVWKSPFAFKAFYETGKLCGEELTFEVSGQRITRNLINKKFIHTAECGNL